MNSLQKVLNEIKTQLPLAEENLEDTELAGHPTLNARRGRKRAAQERLKSLRFEYMTLLRESAVFLIAVGSEKDTLTDLLDPSFGCFKTDPEELYTDIVSKIPAGIYGRETTSSLFGILSRHLEDKAVDLGISAMPLLTFKNEYNVQITNSQELVSLAKKVINKEVGAEIAGIQAVASVVSAAIAREHAERITPIVLSTDDFELAAQLDDALTRLTPRVFTIVAGKLPKGVKKIEGSVVIKEVTPEAVEAAMGSIKASLRR